MKKTKMKIKKSVTRRIKISKNGKLLRRRSFGRHLKASKSKKRSRGLKQSVTITGPFAKKLKQVLGI